MKFSALQEIDSSLEAIFGDPEAMDLESISSSIQPKVNTLTFIKNQKFFDDMGRLSDFDEFKETGIVFEKKYFQSIKESDIYKKAKDLFSWGAIVDNVAQAMSLLSKPFYERKYGQLNYYVDGRQMGNSDIDPTVKIAQNAFIGTHVSIAANVVIMPGAVILPEVSIDEGTVIYPNVTIYPFTKIGKNCRIHASTVIGADGFGYNFFEGAHHKVWHLAGVVIEDNVEIGGAAMVDSGAFIATRIGSGTKLDNFCQISHNSQIGKHCVFAGTAGSSGSGEIGDYCAFGAGAGLAPGARLGAGSQLAARTIVSENSIWPEGSKLAGHPARPMGEWLKGQAKLRQLIKK